MSRATEIAKAEADEAEVENPDAEPVEPIQPDEPDEDEAEAEDEPEPEPSSLAVVENIDKALSAEQKRHANALRKALGEQFEDFQMCPLCQIDGYAVPYGAGEVSPEQREAIMTVLGEGGTPPMKKHPGYKRCEACNGYGRLETDSQMEAYRYEMCDTCQNTGRVAVGQLAAVPAPPAPPQYPWDEKPAEPAPQTFGDEWGRPVGHPDFGIHPAQIVASRQTA